VLLQLVRDAASSTTSVAGSIDANVPAAAQKEFDKGAVALAEGGKEKTEFAVRCFEKAVSIYPKFVEARLKLGTAHMDLAQWEKAEKALLATIDVDAKALNPELATAHLLKGNLLLRVSRTADALVEFGEYLRLEPKGPFAAETRTLVEKIKKATSQSRG
jgi:tetratricopeptide (TPR) repeat protein